MQVAIDTSILVALLNRHDLWNARAETLQNALLAGDFQSTYFDCAVAEAVSAATRRLHEKGRTVEALELLNRLETLIPRKNITWILPDVPHLYPEVLTLMRTSGGELNFNDALMALACRERDIPAIASFDPDFDHVPWLKRLAEPKDL